MTALIAPLAPIIGTSASGSASHCARRGGISADDVEQRPSATAPSTRSTCRAAPQQNQQVKAEVNSRRMDQGRAQRRQERGHRRPRHRRAAQPRRDEADASAPLGRPRR